MPSSQPSLITLVAVAYVAVAYLAVAYLAVIAMNTSLGPPPTGDFVSVEGALAELTRLGLQHGYAVKRADSYPPPSILAKTGKNYPNYVVFTCTKARQFVVENSTVHESKRRKRQGSKKTQCPFRIKAVRMNDTATIWRLQIVESGHNHPPHIRPTADPVNRIKAQS